jgi:endonuclease-3 related protein
MLPAETNLDAACRALVRHYPVRGWWPARSRFEVMVGAVLVQNTRWCNVESAVRALRAAGHLTPALFLTLKPAQLIRLIRPAGCQSVKAQRLQALAVWIKESGGLRRLAGKETATLRGDLLGVRGIGPETADAILCFAFGRQVFIADGYARRWLGRLTSLPADDLSRYERCRTAVEGLLADPGLDFSELHAAIVLHGQSVCGREPDCGRCLIRGLCAHRYGPPHPGEQS